MRIATLIISLVVSLFLTVQSFAVMAAGSISSSLSDTAADKKTGDDLSGGGAVGLFAAMLWVIAAAFVIAKPKVSMWVFAVAGILCILGGTSGFSDLYFYAGASGLFALLSRRGIAEKQEKDERERAAYQADIAAAAQGLSLAK
jgi:hypothetical protein